MKIKVLFILSFILIAISECKPNSTRTIRALQKEHEKPQEEKWAEAFFGKGSNSNRQNYLINLLITISDNYLNECSTVLLYDDISLKNYPLLLDKLLAIYSYDIVIGKINEESKVDNSKVVNFPLNKCKNFIIFISDIMESKNIIGIQHTSKVVIVSSISQWRVHEFLRSDISHAFVNILVITESDAIVSETEVLPFILYTHELYKDGLGTSAPIVLTSWIKSKLTRPNTSLFPKKFKYGFSGHRFIVSTAHQPPFTIKRSTDKEGNFIWDGIEVRLIKIIGKIFNFTTDFREARDIKSMGNSEAIINEIYEEKTSLGVGGLYLTDETISKVDTSQAYTQDCASFISLTSIALSRWRAIMGPFHWTVWLTLTIFYLLAIFPLSFTDRHSLKYLFKSPEEIENMFWYVFGTFTNCFTFKGKTSWTKSRKHATRILIGFYWIFTIIITSCYTGSIIAFVTLPIKPETTDTAQGFLSGHYQIGTLDKGIWQHWFNDTTDPVSKKLLKNVDLLPTVEEGLKNITKAFFWPYAFLGSKAQLDYVVKTSFLIEGKSTRLHIAKECFIPFGVTIIFNRNENLKKVIDSGIFRAVENGLLIKIFRDIEWDMIRSATGELLQASSGKPLRVVIEDRALTLKDTEGMFLLLGFGILTGAISLLSEWLGGCFNICRRKSSLSTTSISSNPFTFEDLTPREKIHSMTSMQSNAEEIDLLKTDDNISENIEECIDKIYDLDYFLETQTKSKGNTTEESNEEE